MVMLDRNTPEYTPGPARVAPLPPLSHYLHRKEILCRDIREGEYYAHTFQQVTCAECIELGLKTGLRRITIPAQQQKARMLIDFGDAVRNVPSKTQHAKNQKAAQEALAERLAEAEKEGSGDADS